MGYAAESKNIARCNRRGAMGNDDSLLLNTIVELLKYCYTFGEVRYA